MPNTPAKHQDLNHWIMQNKRWPSPQSSDQQEAMHGKSIMYLGGRAASFCLALDATTKTYLDSAKCRPDRQDVSDALLKVKKSEAGYRLMSKLLAEFAEHHPTVFREFFSEHPDVKDYLLELDFKMMRGHTSAIWIP